MNPASFARAASRTYKITKQMTDKDLRDAINDYICEVETLYIQSDVPTHLDRLLGIVPVYALCIVEQQKRIEQEN